MEPYKNSSNHTIEVTEGRPLAPGEVADVDPEALEIKAAIEEGQLIPAEQVVETADEKIAREQREKDEQATTTSKGGKPA